MTHTVPSAAPRRAAGTATEARDPDRGRGPSRLGGGVSNTSRERIPTLVLADHDAIAREVADRIDALVRERQAAGQRTVLGLATGSTPIGVYRELIRRH